MEFLLVLLAVMAAGFLFLAFAALRAASSVRKELAGLDRKIAELDQKVDAQAARLQAVSAAIEQHRDSPAFLIADSLGEWKRRGFVGTALLMGVRLFRSYLGSRSPRKALPLPKRPSEK